MDFFALHATVSKAAIVTYPQAEAHEFLPIARACALSAMVVGGLAMLGRHLDQPYLQGIHPAFPGFKYNAALCATSVGLGLLLRLSHQPGLRRLGQFCGWVSAVIGMLTLGEFLFHWDLGIDQLIVRAAEEHPGVPAGRMAIPAALCFTFLGVALMRLEQQLAHRLAIASALLALPILVGYGLGARFFEGILASAYMALNAAVAVILLALAILFAYPRQGWMAVIADPGPIGQQLRRWYPIIVIVWVAVGWLRLQAERAGQFGTAFGVSLMVCMGIVSAMGLLWLNARHALQALAVKEQLAAAQSERLATLEAVARMKEELLSVMSHELRTPLNFIMGFASLMEDEVAGPLTPEQHSYMQKILHGADRMLFAVQNLLDASQILANRFEISPCYTRYHPIVAQALATLAPAASAKGVKLDSQVTWEYELLVDGTRMIQVMCNLVDNAIKFTEAGGQIAVRANVRAGELITEVVDTGAGIAPEDLSKLFVPFCQLDMSSTRRAGGTGLGLTISKAIVEGHGGRMGVESQPGKGSTFWFALPLTEHAADLAER